MPAHDEALVAWQQWCEAHAGQHCRLALSGQWLLNWLAASDAKRPDISQARAQAIEHWGHYLGLEAAVLSSDWTLRPVRVPGGVLVCAMPRALVDDLLAVAAHHGVAVGWMGPWWAPGVARWLANRPPSAARLEADDSQDDWQLLSTHEGGWLTHFRARRQGLQRLWVEREEALSSHALSLTLGPRGLSDDAATAALVQGLAPAWRSQASGALA
ncbi:MAG: hypothetical protein EOP40_02475 [Rubrivivax sp.]|nr:MAG: hypothetical protein EOP40_02475 [Rubrivivax sp.]